MTSSSISAPLLGSVLSERYELVRHIARGGMGDVYEAHDRQLRRQVALKVYRGSALADRSRFDREVVTLAALNHPGLVQVFDAGEHDGDGFVVLELVDGPTLRSIIAERGSLPPAEVAALGATMADALAYVHDRGVVHRDVTPANVLCGPDGRPRLADFGIARLVDTSRITSTANAVGTAAYMAPEQVEGGDVTPAADVYALGLVLREALTGRTAYTGSSHEVAIARLATDPDVVTDVPPAWTPLLAAMTARMPEERPSAAEVGPRIAALADGDEQADAPTLAVPAVTAPATGGAVPMAGSHPIDGHAETSVLEVGGGTTVMPAVLQPVADDEPAVAASSAGSAPRTVGRAGHGSRRVLWVALAAIALVLLAGIASSGGGDVQAPPSSPTTEPVVATTVPTTAPTTTAPPTTAAPRTEKGKGHKKGG